MGATGYAGLELLRLAASHPDFEVVVATGERHAGEHVATYAPALAALYPTLIFASRDQLESAAPELVFVALPHGHSQPIVADLVSRGIAVVDLGADFRLKDPTTYARWYGDEHRAPDLLSRAVYGLVERHRQELDGARLIASPGCYPTATALAMGPFVDHDFVDASSVIVNALSGASGAGRSPSDRLHFARLAGNAEAYALTAHRHTPEMEAELGVPVLFTPHLVPVSRGMLVSAYARVASPATTSDDAMELLDRVYRDDPFIVVSHEPPTLKDPLGSNVCFVSARVDPRTGWLIAMSSLDNLVKGAAGQAIQAWNVASGRPETRGLPRSGVTP